MGKCTVFKISCKLFIQQCASTYSLHMRFQDVTLYQLSMVSVSLSDMIPAMGR